MLNKILTDGMFLCSNSQLDTYIQCPREYYYQYVLKRTPKKKSTALNFGGALHKGLESYYKGEKDYVNKAAQGYTVTELTEWRTTDLLVTTLIEYAKNYPVEIFNPILDSIEKSFAVQLFTWESIPVIWTGKLDMIVEEEGEYWIVDHKSTSMFGPTYFQDFSLSQQMLGYIYAAHKLIEKPIAGVIINVIAVRKPSKTGKGTEYARVKIRYTKEQLSEFLESVTQLISRLLNDVKNQTHYPIFKNCSRKFGLCPYHEVCTLPLNQRDILLNSNAYEDKVSTLLEPTDA